MAVAVLLENGNYIKVTIFGEERPRSTLDSIPILEVQALVKVVRCHPSENTDVLNVLPSCTGGKGV